MVKWRVATPDQAEDTPSSCRQSLSTGAAAQIQLIVLGFRIYRKTDTVYAIPT